ncbi:MAG: hypothetical protein HeimC3_01250 [Candidatus Heimdallarchaeota archaeon LC_3]|nr:MAG: hypothetical protein HeimC3_01250 [Candidatus Heimdallarchaeota archaeon LC_3]
MGCGTSKRAKKRGQETYADSNDDSCSNSYSGGLISAQAEKQRLREMSLGGASSRSQKHYCYNCGNKILLSDIFCENCGVKV